MGMSKAIANMKTDIKSRYLAGDTHQMTADHYGIDPRTVIHHLDFPVKRTPEEMAQHARAQAERRVIQKRIKSKEVKQSEPVKPTVQKAHPIDILADFE